VRAWAVVVTAGIVGLASACSSADPDRRTISKPKPPALTPHHVRRLPPGPAQRALGLPPVPRGPLPGYLLIADRNNNRALIVSPSKRIVWQDEGLRGPDDAFFTPGFRSIITNEEFNDTLTEVSLRTKARIWRYGHDAVPGSSPGYLNTPDDAYRIAKGMTTIADIRNCRIVELAHDKRVLRILGGSCVHDPPRGFASPNGDTPLPDGGLLVTEIGPPGWIDRLAPNGSLVWSVRSPIAYPSDAQLLRNGRILVAGFTDPGRIVEMTRDGRITWSIGGLNKPSLAVRLPNGLIASNDDYNHRVILIDPPTKRIVWQYGHTGLPGTGPGYLNKPDGLDFLPSARLVTQSYKPRRAARVAVRRVGSLPSALSKAAAVALPNGNVVVIGGVASNAILARPPSHLRAIGSLPTPTHDAAAAMRGSAVILYGGGESTSVPTVLRIDPSSGKVRALRPLDEPLSDLGAANVRGTTYLVGGYTGTKYASAILRVGANDRTTTIARLPLGLRYAGVAAYNDRIYVAGGLTTRGPTDLVQLVDPTSREVRDIARLPQPLAHVALVAAGDRLLLVGGGTRNVYEIPTGYGSVRKVATLPQPLTDPSAVSLGKTAVVLGGGTNAVYELR